MAKLEKTGLGACMYYWRKARGLTQQALGDAIGVTKSHLSEMENGRKPTSSKWLDKIASEFKVPLTEILGSGPAPKNPPTTERTLMDDFDALTDEAKVDVLSMMRHMPRKPKRGQ